MSQLELSIRQARRLALVKAGFWHPEWLALPARSRPRGKQTKRRANAWIDHFGYLQLDTVSISGARTHGIVLASRLKGFDTRSAETLLQPGEPLFEYWGHEACWLPLTLYPTFAFRRRQFAVHPWWGDLLNEHPRLARAVLDRARDGAFRSTDLEGERRAGWWNIKLAKRIAEALWSSGDLIIRERRNFQRIYDLPERVIPTELLGQETATMDAYKQLLLRALNGHGFAPTGLLAATWRLRNCRAELVQAMQELQESGQVVPCTLALRKRNVEGWITPADLELVDRIDATKLRSSQGVLLSPFDPLLWDRGRVLELFGFEQVLEIYKPAADRQFGYYCMPILSGDRLSGRVDLKADRNAGILNVVHLHYERANAKKHVADQRAAEVALTRYAAAVGLELAAGRG